MIRPLTCLSLIAALGAGLYLYQEKHRAQMLDRDITRTVKQAEQARDRIGLLKAEWALLNEPDRLAGLAAQHLQLQALQPTQFVRLEDLRSRLPAVSAAPPPVAPAPMDQPVAAATPAQPTSVQVAALPAPLPALAAPAIRSVMAAAVTKPLLPQPSAPVIPVPAAPRPAAPRAQLAAAKPHEAEPAVRAAEPLARVAEPLARVAEPPVHAVEPVRHPLFAPMMPAYAPTPVVVHAPTVQTASAMAPQPSSFVGSALGMSRTVLADPVPVASASALGYASGR